MSVCVGDRFCPRTRWPWRSTLSSTIACRTPRYRFVTLRTRRDRQDCSLRRRCVPCWEPRTSRRSCQTVRTSATSCRCSAYGVNSYPHMPIGKVWIYRLLFMAAEGRPIYFTADFFFKIRQHRWKTNNGISTKLSR